MFSNPTWNISFFYKDVRELLNPPEFESGLKKKDGFLIQRRDSVTIYLFYTTAEHIVRLKNNLRK